MVYYVGTIPYSNELYHYGTQGMRWGNRRYQNADGSLTAAGRAHYGVGGPRVAGASTKKKGLSTAAKVGLGVAGAAALAGGGYLAYRAFKNRNLKNLGNIRRLNKGNGLLKAGSQALSTIKGTVSKTGRAGAVAKNGTRKAANTVGRLTAGNQIGRYFGPNAKNVTGSYERYMRNQILKNAAGAAVVGGSAAYAYKRNKKKKSKSKAS